MDFYGTYHCTVPLYQKKPGFKKNRVCEFRVEVGANEWEWMARESEWEGRRNHRPSKKTRVLSSLLVSDHILYYFSDTDTDTDTWVPSLPYYESCVCVSSQVTVTDDG